MIEDRNAVLEEAAKVADVNVDNDWPNDDISLQAKRIASAIRGLKDDLPALPAAARGAILSADGSINYVVLVACKDNASHKDNGEVGTWADLIKAIEKQLMMWIDQDGLNVRNITISATRDAVYQRRTGPV